MQNSETQQLVKRNAITPRMVERADVIITEVKKSPTNLQEAFRNASKILGTKGQLLENYYYNKIKKNVKTPLFTLTSNEKKRHYNTKNTVITVSADDLTTYDIVLTLMKTLSKEQKVTVMQKLLIEI